MCDERSPILLKRELSQRLHRLDEPRPIKNGLAGGGDVLYELNGNEQRRLGNLFAVAR